VNASGVKVPGTIELIQTTALNGYRYLVLTKMLSSEYQINESQPEASSTTGLGYVNAGTSYKIVPLGKKSPDGKTFYWYSADFGTGKSSADYQLNRTDTTYYWMAIQ